MTIPADTALSYLAGQIYAIAGAEAILEGPEGEAACLNRGRAFTTFVTVPIGTYFVSRWPEWSWMYLAGETARSPVAKACGLSAYVGAHELGFRCAAKHLRKGKPGRAVAHLVVSSLAMAVLGLIGLERLRWLGDERSYRLGLATDVLHYPDFMISMACAVAYAAPFVALVILRNYRQGRGATPTD
ncbi:MAG: hypothetical protein V1748_07825 [Actinomycetota bacterium]